MVSSTHWVLIGLNKARIFEVIVSHGLLVWALVLICEGTIVLVPLILSMYAFLTLGLAIGGHRGLTHGAFQPTSTSAAVVLLLLFYTTGQGPLGMWRTIHLLHHRLTDMLGDPHSPLFGGFFRAHTGWLLEGKQYDLTYPRCLLKFLSQERLEVFDRLVSSLVPILLLVGLYWVSPLASLAYASALALIVQAVGSLASFCHTPRFGSQPYDLGDQSTDVWWVALVTSAEGNQNTHHRAPSSAQLGRGICFAEPDPCFAAIMLLERIGVVSKVNCLPPIQEGNPRSA